jgi:RNA polymerase sigma factor (sigma-70 family)
MVAALKASREWSPDGGKSLESYCRMKAAYAMVDFGREELPHIAHREHSADMDGTPSTRIEGFGFGALAKHIETLSDRHQELLRLMYVAHYTQADVARLWGLSRERIRQIHGEAMEVLRGKVGGSGAR